MRLANLWTSDAPRRFAGEVGIIVLGVVIALWLGEIVEAANWAERRNEAQAALKVELTQSAINARERHRISGCLDRRLAQIAAVIEHGAQSGRLPAVSNFPQPPMRPWRTTSWETAVASQAASRFPVPTLNELASAYQTIEQIRFWNIAKKEAWTSLSVLEADSRPLSPQLEIYLRDAHARAKYYARIIPIVAQQLSVDIRQAGIDVPAPNVRRQQRTPDRATSVCEPILVRTG